MASIEKINVADDIAALWGVKVCEYTVNAKQVDFQDLMVAISERRAVSVEGEVTPLTTRIRARNSDLEILGKALSELTSAQATLKADASAGTHSSYMFSNDVKARVVELTAKPLSDNEVKEKLEYFIQMVKSKIDGLNNEAQTDMSRLQSLVDRRDESYSTATNLMTSVSDTRSNLIRNL